MFIIDETVYVFPMLILNIGFIYFFMRLKAVIIELSGGCISIKKYHPLTFRSFINPFIELPHNCIQNYSVSKRLGFGGLIIKVKSKRGKKFAVQISLMGFTATQKKTIKTSLQSICRNNYDDSLRLVVA